MTRHERHELAPVTTTLDITCNKCGESLRNVTTSAYEGLVGASIVGGYGSRIGDCVRLSFDLCEDCVLALIADFKETPYDLKG